MKGKLTIKIKIIEVNAEDYSFDNHLTIEGYTLFGMSRQDLVEWVDDTSGIEIKNSSPLQVLIYGDKGGQDDVMVDTYVGWIVEEAGKDNVIITTKEQ